MKGQEQNGQETILVKNENFITTVVINRPEMKNSISPEMYVKLTETVDQLADDPDTRVIIMRGAGQEAFSAGADLSRMQGSSAPPPRPSTRSRNISEALEAITKPVIAMIYGYALGGGCDLAASCDLRFASETARFGIPAARRGIVYGHGSTLRIIHLVGPSFAKEILFTGRQFDVHEANAMGLVNRIVPNGELEEFTYRYASEIAENAPLSVRGAKTIINTLLKDPTLSRVEELNALAEEARKSEDFKEGVRAFMEKRKPRFMGR